MQGKRNNINATGKLRIQGKIRPDHINMSWHHFERDHTPLGSDVMSKCKRRITKTGAPINNNVPFLWANRHIFSIEKILFHKKRLQYIYWPCIYGKFPSPKFEFKRLRKRRITINFGISGQAIYELF